MGIEETNYSAIDIVNLVDGAELVTVVREIYLCVWHGGSVVDVYDLTDASKEPDCQVLPMFAPRCMLTVHDAIDDYFEALDFDNENEGLTTNPVRGIVYTESDDPTEVN
jgi:hypothetical protein|tara:strand:+ start:63 stop:389 length:327 start_codon:yes stop_codon:yes gene_type:complete